VASRTEWCPKCQKTTVWEPKDKLYQCQGCREETFEDIETFKCKKCGSEDLCFSRTVDIDFYGEGQDRWGYYYCGGCGAEEDNDVPEDEDETA
jgi:hypothetical protein